MSSSSYREGMGFDDGNRTRVGDKRDGEKKRWRKRRMEEKTDRLERERWKG